MQNSNLIFKFGFFSVLSFAVLTFFSLSVGTANISFSDIFACISGGDVDEMKKVILFQMRLPRLVMALIVGMLLATSGVVVQSVFLNPVADPYIIGIASAATFGAVVAYLLKLPDIFYGVFAFLCAAGLSIVIFKLSKKNRSIATLLIVGIAISAFLGSFTAFATYLIGEDSFKITAWLMGYIGSASWSKILILLPPLMIVMIYFYTKRHELNIILSGDEEAKSLGVDVEKSKKNLLIASSLLIGFSVAFTGMISFVGLIIPHTLRMLLKTSSNAILIPTGAVAGGLFLLFCDIIAKNILSPIEVPIGVVTSFFGAPFFLFLALKSIRGIR